MFQVFFIICLIINQQTSAFDLWELIEKANKVDNKGPSGGGIQGPQFDTSNVVEGDILIDRRPLQDTTQERYLVFDWHKKLWRTREIPYLITGSLTSAENRKIIVDSLDMISKVSCLTFVPKTNSDNHWLEFYVASGCFSGIGRKYYYDKTPTKISLGNLCVHPSIVVHEVLHALGFFHEQSRTDRDSFVTIYRNRIIPSMFSNFKKTDLWETYYYGTTYDLSSIMHYSRRSFTTGGQGNTIESKFDPNMNLGNDKMSETDITELNKLYQCDVKSGWGKWTPWSPCLKNWKNECFKAKVRVCVSENLSLCPGANKYGVQEDTQDCPLSQCEAAENKQDGQWGHWGMFTKCESTCGWGKKKRTRVCDNPRPSNGGTKCEGSNNEQRICRNKRCAGNKSNDNQFNTNTFGRWISKGFTLKQTSGWSNGGPKRDHTSELTGQTSYYASARGKAGWVIRDSKKQLWSPFIESPRGSKCIMFSYMLNGADLHKTDALSVFVKDGNGVFTNLAFRKGGHQGNVWQQAALDISGQTARFQIVFEVACGSGRNNGRLSSWRRHISEWNTPKCLPSKIVFEVLFQQYRESEVAIDDLFFDHNACRKGVGSCEDLQSSCKQRALNGDCYTKATYQTMLTQCCTSCNDPEYAKQPGENIDKCLDTNTNCKGWASGGECKKNPAWMTKYCCKSCKEVGSKSPLDCDGTISLYVLNSKTPERAQKNCNAWTKNGECQKNPWMLKNCCIECRDLSR